MSQLQELHELLIQGKLDARLQEIYVDPELLPAQRERYIDALKEFEGLFGPGETQIYSAPGRSEVAGNHTDHQRGQVLAAAVNLDAIAVVRPVEEPVIRLQSQGYHMLEIDLGDLAQQEKELGTSAGLIRGMAQGLSQRGYQIGGFNAYVTSQVLGGAGLSSSASFEVLVGVILSGLYNEMRISAVEIAQVAQYAENVYFGKPCGLMDQMACAVGGLIHIDFEKDDPLVEQVKVDFGAYGHSLCITDTKGSHADLTDEYAAVPQEMCKVAQAMGQQVLRQVSEQEFYQQLPELRTKLGDRPVLRAMHFFAEEERVEGQVKALEQGDFSQFLDLISASGASSFQFLQNVYTSQQVQSQAVSIGLAVSQQVLGNPRSHGVSRVHGGGFAGTIQAFVEDSYVKEYQKALDHVFGEGSCHVLQVRPSGGILVI